MHKCNSLAVLGKPQTEAVAYCNKVATTFEKISRPSTLVLYNNMGNVLKINDPKTALDFYTLSYENLQK